MQSAENVFNRIKQERVVATVVIDNIDNASRLADTLFEAGLSSIELTLRTDCALDVIRHIAEKHPQMLVGAGTVLTPEQVRQVKDAGAAFAVAPGLNPEVVEEALKVGLPFAPGVCTPSEVEKALSYGCKSLKFFPSEPLGGLKYLKSMAAPYFHTGIGFIPLGGIDAGNFIEYLKQDYIIAVGGSWLAPRDSIASGKWQHISDLCNEAAGLIADFDENYSKR
jgi:2-dehydro-3-deoxyphosphogluconate aldolase / (4S)-4-hydroxy-2-oxoglutarate aldolase